ncbi:ChaB family protein [Neisseriaceae bacterium ESL0693]|nr:ChaB family protein [Neisseriaceae bacterium ESL0693]
MPYATRADLPVNVRHVLPEHAQDIFREAFNHAFEEYQNPAKRRDHETPEVIAFRVAWAAVENEYQKDKQGQWRRKN